MPEDDEADAERLEGRRKPVEWEEGNGGCPACPIACHDQPFNAREALDPAAVFRASQGAVDCQGVSVICGGAYRIRKCLLPLIIIRLRLELDMCEKVFLGTRNTRPRDEATLLQCLPAVA